MSISKAGNPKPCSLPTASPPGRQKRFTGSLKAQSHPVSLLILKTLWPVPEAVIRRAAGGVKRVIALEMNLGQYVWEIKRILADQQVDFYGQMDGRLISPQKIKETIIHG